MGIVPDAICICFQEKKGTGAREKQVSKYNHDIHSRVYLEQTTPLRGKYKNESWFKIRCRRVVALPL